jgi:hypothetical protein
MNKEQLHAFETITNTLKARQALRMFLSGPGGT